MTLQICCSYIYIALGKYGLVIRLSKGNSLSKYDGIGNWFIIKHFINNGRYYHDKSMSNLVSYWYLFWRIPLYQEGVKDAK